MTNDFLFDVFLSHNHKDKPRVRRLAERLRDAGLRVWFDEWSVKAGEIISLKVDEGLEHSRVLLLCMSANALASNWVALERSTAIHRDPSNEGRRFIPLLLSDCDLPATLQRYKYVDFRDETDESFAQLLTACRVDVPEVRADAQRARTPSPDKTARSSKRRQSLPLAELEPRIFADHLALSSIAVTPDGKSVISGSSKTVKIWDLETGECRKTINTTSGVWAVRPVKDNRIVWLLETGILEIFNTQDEEIERSFSAHPNFGRSLTCSADGGICASASASTDHVVKLWEMPSGKLLQTLRGQVELGWSVAIDAEAKVLVSGGYSGEIRAWNLEAGINRPLKGHGGIIKSLSLTPDGRFAASASSDTTIRIWDLETAACVGTLEGHGEFLQAAVFSHDGNLLASAGF